MNTASPMNAKASLTFESVVCSQIELKRRAASFSRRRSTMCRRPSQYLPSPSTGSDRLSISSNRTVLPSSLLFLSQSNGRPSVSAGPSDTSNQFLRTNTSNNDSKRSRASSTYSLGGTGLENIEERQSLVSMLYWDRSSKSAASKKVNQLTLRIDSDSIHEACSIFFFYLGRIANVEMEHRFSEGHAPIWNSSVTSLGRIHGLRIVV